MPKFSSIRLRSSSTGFTLIELLIVLAIIAILSGITIASFREPTNRQQIKASALAIKSELRRYQNYAISGQKVPNLADTSCQDAPMLYYRIILTEVAWAGPTDFQADLLCQDGAGPVLTSNITNESLWAAEKIGIVNFETPCVGDVEIRFLPLNRGTEVRCGGNPVNQATARISNLLDTSYIYEVTITKDGVINAQVD